MPSQALPDRLAGYCADAHVDARVYGEGAQLPLRDACVELFGERCSEHLSYGLEHVIRKRYIPDQVGHGSVQVRLLRFTTVQGALGSFSQRVIGEQDPAAAELSPHEAGDLAALGADLAFMVQGAYFAELRYDGEQQAAQQARRSAQAVLPQLLRALADALPRDTRLPEELLALPSNDRIPLGVRYVARDVLEIDGTGPGAIGYYRRDGKRWRVLSIHYSDADAAKDAALTLRKTLGWMPRKETPYDSFKLTFPVPDTGLTEEWVITQQLNRVWGVGDEVTALDPALSDSALAARRLSYDEKIALLGRLLRLER